MKPFSYASVDVDGQSWRVTGQGTDPSGGQAIEIVIDDTATTFGRIPFGGSRIEAPSLKREAVDQLNIALRFVGAL